MTSLMRSAAYHIIERFYFHLEGARFLEVEQIQYILEQYLAWDCYISFLRRFVPESWPLNLAFLLHEKPCSGAIVRFSDNSS